MKTRIFQTIGGATINRVVKFEKNDIGHDGHRLTFGPGVLEQIKAVYYDRDVDNEIKSAQRWLLRNPDKRHFVRFFLGWLDRANEKVYHRENVVRRDPAGDRRKTPVKLSFELMERAIGKPGVAS